MFGGRGSACDGSSATRRYSASTEHQLQRVAHSRVLFQDMAMSSSSSFFRFFHLKVDSVRLTRQRATPLLVVGYGKLANGYFVSIKSSKVMLMC